MRRLTLISAGILVAQFGLALTLFVNSSGHASFQPKKPLLTFDASAVDRIDIDESGAGSVSLTRSGGSWALPSLAGFPADDGQVMAFLAKLSSLKRGWAAATSAEAAQRFKVAEDSHERRIILRKGETAVQEILLGTSPTFHHVYARVGKDPNIYTLPFTTYDVGTRGEDWMRRDVLNIPDDRIASLAIGDLRFERKDGRYVLDGLAEGEKQKDDEVYRLVATAAHPLFEGVRGKGRDALAKLDEPDIQVSVKTTDGAEIVLKYKKESEGDAYLFSSSASDYLLRTSEAMIEPLIKAKREMLVEARHDGKGAEAKGQTAPASASGG